MQVRRLGLVLVGALGVAGAWADQVWDREVLPGVTFRMERIEGMNLNVYGVRLAKGAVTMEPVLAKGTVYDSSATNGRSTVTQLVQENNAIGGINGDFFQFGDDPGGDPAGAMVRFGELLSLPRTSGRYASYGWSANVPFEHVNLEWSGTVNLPGGGSVKIDDLYARVDANQLVLSDSAAAEIYSAEEYLVVRLAGDGMRRYATNKWSARVVGVEKVTGRYVIHPGERVLAAHGRKASRFEGVKVGDLLMGEMELKGLDSKAIPHVMGGGPVLVRDGEAVNYGEDDNFATTKHPRSAVGVTAEGDVWFLVADGRQTQSAGIGLNDLGLLMKRWGCVNALNLDGGGSSAIHLMGLTLNKPSGGVERLVANGVVWHTERPAPGPKFEIYARGIGVKVGETMTLRVRRENGQIENEKVLWTAQGDAWIDQDGVLHGVKAGTVLVSAMVDGRIERLMIRVMEAS